VLRKLVFAARAREVDEVLDAQREQSLPARRRAAATRSSWRSSTKGAADTRSASGRRRKKKGAVWRREMKLTSGARLGARGAAGPGY